VGLKGGGGKLQFSNTQLQISDRGDAGAGKFNFVPKFSRKSRIFSSKFCFWTKIFERAEIYEGSCHDATVLCDIF